MSVPYYSYYVNSVIRLDRATKLLTLLRYRRTTFLILHFSSIDFRFMFVFSFNFSYNVSYFNMFIDLFILLAL